MTLTTIIEACPPWLYKFALGSKNSELENQYQGINRTISYKGGCTEEQGTKFKVCPLKANKLSTSQSQPSPSSTCTGSCNTNADNTGNMRDTRFVDILESVREPIADYQEKHGLPKCEQYGFVNLVTSLSQHAYHAILTIFTMLYNLLPLLEGFSYLARFVLDKLIEICQTHQKTEKMIKISMFVGELIVIILMLMVICGFILLPVWYLFSHMIGKLWSMLLSSG